MLVSAYLPPDKDYDRALAELEHAVRNIGNNKKILICSDTNSRSPLWSDKELNQRGEKFEQFVAANHFMILNSDDHNPTFTNRNGSSKIDLILSNDSGLDLKPETELRTEFTGSDHKMISITFDLKASQRSGPFRGTTRIYRNNKANWLLFEESLQKFEHIIRETNFEVKNKMEADSAISNLNDYLKKVCDASIPKLRHTGKRRENQNDEIDRLSKLEDNLNSRINRLKGEKNPFEAALLEDELSKVSKLKTAAVAEQRKTCMEKRFVNADINEAYKIHKTFKARLNRSCPTTIKDSEGKMTENSHQTTQKLFEHCFPDKKHPKLQHKIENNDLRSPHRITEWEVSTSINWMTNNKAPEKDGFTPEIIKRALHKILTPITKLYNELLSLAYFPDVWKGKGKALQSSYPNQTLKLKPNQ